MTQLVGCVTSVKETSIAAETAETAERRCNNQHCDEQGATMCNDLARERR